MDDNQKLSFELAKETIKLYMKICIFILTISVSLYQVYNVPRTNWILWVIALTWLFLFISIVMGLLTIMAMTGNLAQKEVDIYKSNVKGLCISQIIFFLVGLLFWLITTICAVASKPDKAGSSKNEDSVIMVERVIKYTIVEPECKDTIELRTGQK